MKIEMLEIRKVLPFGGNPRLTDDAVGPVAESIRQFGWRQPIVVDSKGVIVAGHVRFLAAQKLGLKKVPVHVARDLTAKQIRAYRLADNKLHELAVWNMELLVIELAAVTKSGYDLSQIGFVPIDIETGQDSPVDTQVLDASPQLGEQLHYKLIVECENEKQQATLLLQFERQGLTCKAMII